MASSRDITLFHIPNTRSTGALILLEELGAPYELRVLDRESNEQRKASYLSINPMGKVPALLHDGALVTEQAAIYIYLADLFAEAGLAPAVGELLRGPYLRWMVFYGSCFEPALIDRSQQRAPAPAAASPYGDYETMLTTLIAQLEPGPYLLGAHFTAADVLWGTALTWTTRFKLVPELPAVRQYTDRVNARPAFARARAKDAELAASRQR